MRKNIFLITIKMGNQELLDYPQHLPLPRIGEIVSFKGVTGKVAEISHTVNDKGADIEITLRSRKIE